MNKRRTVLNVWKRITVFCILVSVLITAVACSPASSSPTPIPTVTKPVENVDPFGKYATPITLTAVKRTLSTTKYNNGDSEENNNWTRFLKDQGIEIKYLWTTDQTQYENKLNISIASGDIPDLISQCYSNQYNKLVAGDMLMDMKPYLDKYATPELKLILGDSTYSRIIDSVQVDGKLFFIPSYAEDLRNPAPNLFIRSDWLKKANLSAPKTIDEFMAVCEAFTKIDPAKGTYGLAIDGKTNLIKDWSGLYGFFSMYNAQPGVSLFDNMLFYEKDSAGKVIWSGSKPGVIDALKALQEMYKKGYLSKDFGTNDIVSDVVAGKAGMFFGAWWCASWPLPDLRAKDPEADWIVCSPPTVDGSRYRPVGFYNGSNGIVVSAKCKNPEAVVKIMNWYNEKAYVHADTTLIGGDYSDASSLYENNPAFIRKSDYYQIYYQLLNEAVKSKDTSKLDANMKSAYDLILAYQADPKNPANAGGWGTATTYLDSLDSGGKQNFATYKPEDILVNAYFLPVTEDINKLLPTYKKMAEEAITKIIYGAAPAEDWNKTVESWNKQGGDTLLAIVQAAAK